MSWLSACSSYSEWDRLITPPAIKLDYICLSIPFIFGVYSLGKHNFDSICLVNSGLLLELKFFTLSLKPGKLRLYTHFKKKKTNPVSYHWLLLRLESPQFNYWINHTNHLLEPAVQLPNCPTERSSIQLAEKF